MPIVTDATLNFPEAATGYTFDASKIEFLAGGGARLKSSFATGQSNINTLDVDTSTWGPIQKVVVTATDVRSGVSLYTHGFYVSFDGGDNWQIFSGGAWRLPLSLDEAMTRTELEAVRHWPADLNVIRFRCIPVRTGSNAAVGKIELITIHYLETLEDEPVAVVFAGEPDGADVLTAALATTPTLAILPDFDLKRGIAQAIERDETDMGYQISFPLCSDTRDSYDLVWANRNGDVVGDIEDLIAEHHEIAFIWTPRGSSAPKKWVFVSEVEKELVDTGAAGPIYTLKATARESKP